MMIYSNQVAVSGKVFTFLTLDHEFNGEKFYRFTLSIKRTSGTKDFIPVIVSERIMDVTKDYKGKHIEIIGQFRSYNNHCADKVHLLLYVYALEIFFNTEEDDTNNVFLEGYICKPPVFRSTPLGREITDFTLAVNRSYEKSDYIPCISWGKNAKYISTLPPSTHIKVVGRVQSREYVKNEVTHTAYELSVINLEVEKEEA